MKTSTNKYQIGQTVHIQGVGIAKIAGKTRKEYIIASPVDGYHYFCKESELRKVKKIRAKIRKKSITIPECLVDWKNFELTSQKYWKVFSKFLEINPKYYILIDYKITEPEYGYKKIDFIFEKLQNGISFYCEDFAKAIYEEITPEQAEINAKIMQK